MLSVLAGAETGMDLAVGEVVDCAIGACIQVEGYDVSRLSADVAYRDNVANLAATSLPIPQAAEGLDPL
jgi:hypothetical protein